MATRRHPKTLLPPTKNGHQNTRPVGRHVEVVARRWPCQSCHPLTAVGRFRGGHQLLYFLHGVECDEPLVRRQTLTFRVTGRESRAA